MVEQIIAYIAEDPLRVLYVLGGSGGLYFWIDKWNTRIRFELLSLKEVYNPTGHACDVSLKMRCRNLSNIKTSLNSKVKVFGYFGLEAPYTKISSAIDLDDSDLTLAPHVISSFTGNAKLNSSYFFPVLRKFRIISTVGTNKTIYYIGRSTECSAPRWYTAFILIKLFNIKPKERPHSKSRP